MRCSFESDSARLIHWYGLELRIGIGIAGSGMGISGLTISDILHDMAGVPIC